MIVFPSESQLRVVTQPDHARVAAEMLSLWRAGGLPGHPRRSELLFAVREHDNGWRETDAAPHVDPSTGSPYSFLDLPDPQRMELWDRATLRFAADHPYAALLITRHGQLLHADRDEDEAWAGFLASLEQRRTELLEAAGVDLETADDDYRWLELADALSLRACGALDAGIVAGGIRIDRQGDALRLAPFPLAGSTTFSIPCRYIPRRRYSSDSDLAVELAEARWTDFKVRLVPSA